MGKLTIQAGKGKIQLEKSKDLVGLKVKKNHSLPENGLIEKQLFDDIGGFKVVSLKRDKKTLDKSLDLARRTSEVVLGTHVYLAEGGDKPLIPTGELILIFQDNTNREEQGIVLDEYHLELVERRSATHLIARVTEKSPNPIKVAHALAQISLIKVAEPDLDMLVDEYAFSPPGDDLMNDQWHLRNVGMVPNVNYRIRKGADARVVDAWTRIGNMGSQDVTIAVIDNGFDLSHPDFQGKVVRPFDLKTQTTQIRQGDPQFSHGTPCASVALASANGNGIVGVAPLARFMPVNGTSYSLRTTEQMFEYCMQNGADIISCSWGTIDPAYSLNAMKEAAITRAVREGRNGKGCIVLFAVGNDDKDYVSHYAAHPDVIAVAACTSQDQHAPYSNRGRQVSVCAPSNGDWPIIAARAWWDPGISSRGTGDWRFWADGRSRGSRYKHFGGTSASTPLVAGICALMLSANPHLTARQVKQILQDTADKIGQPWEYVRGHSPKYGYGRVNADRAVAEAQRLFEINRPSPRQPDQPTSTPPSVQPSVTSGQGLFQFSVRQQPASGWGVQTGVFADYGNVLTQVEKLERRFGIPVFVFTQESGGKTVYKIIVGAFNDRNDAAKLLQQLQAAGINGFIKGLHTL